MQFNELRQDIEKYCYIKMLLQIVRLQISNCLDPPKYIQSPLRHYLSLSILKYWEK